MTNNFDLPILNLLNPKTNNNNSADIVKQLSSLSNPLILPRLEENPRHDESSDVDDIEEQQRRSRLAGPTSKKVKFTKAEDATLLALVQELSTKDWKAIAEHMPPRTARQCRERWTNYVNPVLSREPWTQEEDLLLIQKHAEVGNRWKIIEKYFPGRSKNNIKQRWATMKDMMVTDNQNNAAGQTTITINYNSKPTRPANAPVSLQTIRLMQSLQQKHQNETDKEPVQISSLFANDRTSDVATALAKAVVFPNQPHKIQSLTLPVLTLPSNSQVSESEPILSSSLQSEPAVVLHGAPIQPQVRSLSLPTPTLGKKLPVLPSINSAFIQPSLHSNTLSVGLGNPTFGLSSTPTQQGVVDQFKFFDRILDQHEVYVTEIDKHDLWNFPEENYF